MHLTPSAASPAAYAGDLIGFTTGLLLSLTLLVLTLRAARMAVAPLANIAFALCALLWSAGGLAGAGFQAAGLARTSSWAVLAQAVHYAGAAAFPLPVLATWRRFAATARQKKHAGIVQILAALFAAAVSLWVWTGTAGLAMLRHVTSTGAALLLGAGAAVCLRRGHTPRAVYASSLAIVLAVCGAAAAMAMVHAPTLYSIGSHLVLLVVCCAFLLFARFRYADLFLRYGVRILLAGIWAGVLVAVTQSPILWMGRQSHAPSAIHILTVIVLANLLLLSFSTVDEFLSRRAVRWLFRPPDYRSETRRLAERLRRLSDESEIAAVLEETACGTLELAAAHVQPAGGAAAGELIEGGIIDLGHDLLIPITSAGGVSHVFKVSPGPARPGLVSTDVDYLRALAAQCGIRLDNLRREREAAERESREATLLRQVTEAELRALRAQINPHFLFNSLNTIADLIVRDPARAETMTVRLAGIFRHVLAQSSRPLTTVSEEIEFLRTYLYIEEVRFADRLQVEIRMDPQVANAPIPSLILQPLVENALKHGLGPKPGPVRLWISAEAADGRIRLCVEDDGMGPDRVGESGTGLANTRERLRTLYGDVASLSVEPRAGGGTVTTVLLPLVAAGGAR